MNHIENINALKEDGIISEDEAKRILDTIDLLGKNPDDEKVELALSSKEIKDFIFFVEGIYWNESAFNQGVDITQEIFKIWQKMVKQLESYKDEDNEVEDNEQLA